MHIHHAATVGSVTYSMSLCLFMMLLELVKDTKVQGCISSFSSLCHTGCKTLYRMCNQYMLARKRVTVQTWADCRCAHMCCLFSNNPQNLPICLCSLLHASSSRPCCSPYTSACVRFPLGNTIMKITTRQSSIKRSAHPSLYPFPTKNY